MNEVGAEVAGRSAKLASMTETDRSNLAKKMVGTLPKYGAWANSVREFETPFGTLGFRQAAVLWVLRHQMLPGPEATPTRLARFFGVQPSVMSRALSKLEASGFTVRSTDESDSRISRITITESGTAVSEYVEQLYVDDMIGSTAILTETQVAEMMRCVELLNVIVDDLEKKRVNRSRRGTNPAGR